MGNSQNYRDTIGSGRQVYSNPYDTRYANLESLKQQRAQDYRRDRMETSGQKMERELWQKFLSKNAGQMTKLALAARVGKYAFLAILLPPYLFFYGFPKWVLQNVLPKFSNLPQIAAQPILNALSRMGDYLNYLKEQAVRFSDALGNLAKNLGQGLKNFIAPLQDLLKKLQSQMNRAFHSLRRLQKIPADLFSAFNRKISDLSDLIAKPFKNFSNNLSDGFNRARKFFIVQLLKPYQWTESMLPKLGKFMGKAGEQWSRFDGLMRGYFDRLSLPMKTLFEFAGNLAGGLEARWEKLFLRMKKLGLREGIEKLTEKGSELVSQAALPVVQAVQQTIVAIPNLFIPLISPVRNGAVRFGNGLKEFQQAMSSKVQKMRDFFGQGAEIFKRTFDWLSEKVKQAVSWMIAQARVAPGYFWEQIKKLALLFVKLFKKLVLVMQILFIWCRIIVRVGFKLVKEVVG